LIVVFDKGAVDQLLLALAHLVGLVAVGLLRGDLAEQVAFEEGQQMPRQRQFVILAGTRRELVSSRLEPLRGELVEGRLSLWAARISGFGGCQISRRTSARTLASPSSAFLRVHPSADEPSVT
jgi:hypothetical protein